jgi:hypothetical protein
VQLASIRFARHRFAGYEQTGLLRFSNQELSIWFLLRVGSLHEGRCISFQGRDWSVKRRHTSGGPLPLHSATDLYDVEMGGN